MSIGLSRTKNCTTSPFYTKMGSHAKEKLCDFRDVRTVVESAYCLRHARLSVCPHVSARLPLDGFPLNVITGAFMKMCPANPNLVKSDSISVTLREDLSTFHC